MWIQPPEHNEARLALDAFCSDFVPLDRPSGVAIPIVQPVGIQLAKPGRRVSDSSFGQWDWQMSRQADGQPIGVDTPATGAWPSVVLAMEGYTHRHRCPLTVWRFATDFAVERNTRKKPARTWHRLLLDNEPVSVGFSMDVDGIAVHTQLQVDLDAMRSTPLARALRTTYFEHRVRTDPVLVAGTSSAFLRDWIAQLALCVVAVQSANRTDGFDQSSLADGKLVTLLVDVAKDVFGAADEGFNRDESDLGLVIDIQRALQDKAMMLALRECLTLLERDVDDEAIGWIRERMAATLAAAITDAIQTVCPDMDVSDVCPDIVVRNADGDPPYLHDLDH